MNGAKGMLERPLLPAITAFGLIGLFAAYFTAGPERFWMNWIFWFLYLATAGLGCLFVTALEYVVGARWSVPVRRAAERLSGLTLLAAPAALIALFSLPVLYPWAREEGLRSPIIAGKAAWLNVPFFAVRAIACVFLWALAHRILVGGSIRQDETRDPAITVRARRFAPIFMVIFALTITLLGFDWISSLEPEWYSDMFGVYVFAGTFLAGLAATTLAVLHLKDRGKLPGVGFDHLYNLGGLLFAFTVFWSYIGFAQYMLIWYANMPEEVTWYKARIEGGWLPVLLAIAILHFFIPFFALIPKEAKGNPARLRRISILVLLAHGLDLYWMLFPVLGKGPVLGFAEISGAVFFFGLAFIWIRRSMSKGADMPVGDPFLKEGLEFRL